MITTELARDIHQIWLDERNKNLDLHGQNDYAFKAKERVISIDEQRVFGMEGGILQRLKAVVSPVHYTTKFPDDGSDLTALHIQAFLRRHGEGPGLCDAEMTHAVSVFRGDVDSVLGFASKDSPDDHPIQQKFLSMMLALHKPDQSAAYVVAHATNAAQTPAGVQEQVIVNTLGRMGKLNHLLIEAPISDEGLLNRVRFGADSMSTLSQMYGQIDEKTLVPFKASHMRRHSAPQYLFAHRRDNYAPWDTVRRSLVTKTITDFFDAKYLVPNPFNSKEIGTHNDEVRQRLEAVLTSVDPLATEFYLLPAYIREALEKSGYQVGRPDPKTVP